MDLTQLGRSLLVLGLVIAALGLLLLLGGRLPGAGRLPGDILIRRDGVTLYFPLATSILLSLLLTLVLNLFLRR